MKMSKKLISLILVCLMVLLAGCAGNAKSEPPATTEGSTTTESSADVKGKHLIVGIAPGYVGFNEQVMAADGTTTIQGIDADIIEYMSQDLGFTYEIEAIPELPTLLTKLQQGQVDVAITAMYETAERKKVIDMSQGYVTARTAVLFRATDGFKDMTSLEGKTVSCCQGEAFFEGILGVIPNSSLLEFDRTAVGVQAIINKQTDAMMIDAAQCKMFVDQYPDLSYFVCTNEMIPGIEDNHFSMGFTKGTGLVDIFDAEITKMKQDGTMKEIVEKWLGPGFADAA